MGAGSVNRSLRKPGDMKAILCTRGQHADGSLPQGRALQPAGVAGSTKAVCHPHAGQDKLSTRERPEGSLPREMWLLAWRWPEGNPGNLPGHCSTSPPGGRPWRLVHTPPESRPVFAAAAGTHTMYRDSHLGHPSPSLQPEGPDMSRTRKDAGGKNHPP